MSTTQLFVELLVIGLGALAWLGLFVAGALRLPFEKGLPSVDTFYAVQLTALAYVLGIIVDRVARRMFGTFERHNEHHQLTSRGMPSASVLERRVLVGFKPLAQQIDYNRSRLRICRAWAFNFLMIGLALAVWRWRLREFGLGDALFLIGASVLLALAAGWAATILIRDHYTNLAEAHQFLAKGAAGVPGGSGEGEGAA